MNSTRSSKSKLRLYAAGIAVIAVGIGSLLLPNAAIAQQGGVGGLANGGVLQLHLGSSGSAPQDYFGFRDANGTGYASTFAQTQTISNGQGCKLAPTTGALVTLESSATAGQSSVGFVGDAIGVRTNSEGNGQPCGRIDAPGQKLTFRLSLAGKMIDYAELDLELKFGGTVSVQGYIGNSPVGSAVEYGSNGSDSGPDSGDGDNYRVRFPKTGFTLVNRLDFTIKGNIGGASLEGGADGTVACRTTSSVPSNPAECGPPVNFSLGETLPSTDSLFHLVNVDGVLDCGDQAPAQGGGDNPTNLLTRQNNAIDPETGLPFPCDPIPFNLETAPGATRGCIAGSPQCLLMQTELHGEHDQYP